MEGFKIKKWFTSLFDQLRDTRDLYTLVLVIGAFFWFFVPYILNSFMCTYKIPTNPDLDIKDWLSFWGGYLGGSLSAMVGMGAILASHIQNRKHHDETLRLSVLPLLDMKSEFEDNFEASKTYDSIILNDDGTFLRKGLTGYYINLNSTKKLTYEVILTNVGMSSAFQLFIECKEERFAFPSLSKDQSTKFYFCLQKGQNCSFVFEFKDLMSNTYTQEINIDADKWEKEKDFCERTLSFPKLIPNPSCKTDPSTRQPSEVNP